MQRNGHAGTGQSNAGHLPSRRTFLACAAAGLWALRAGGQVAGPAVGNTPRTPVAVTQGESRADNVFQALKRIEPQVKAALAGKQRVVIKPNMVVVDRPLAASHAECLEGILEFLSPLVRDEIIIAETPANGPAEEGYSNYGYRALADRYPVRFLDLDDQPFTIGHMVDERRHARPVRLSSMLLDPDAFLISTANMKTHDRAVVTLGCKNITVGAILKDSGFRWGAGSRGVSDKHLVHGGPENQGIHFNLFSLAQRIRPSLTVLDGFEGMEHNGPISGTPVDHRVAVASTDWLAADRVAAELMGFDFEKVGYLAFAARAGLGETDLGRLDILGPALSELVRPYRPHDTVEQQYGWM